MADKRAPTSHAKRRLVSLLVTRLSDRKIHEYINLNLNLNAFVPKKENIQKRLRWDNVLLFLVRSSLMYTHKYLDLHSYFVGN